MLLLVLVLVLAALASLVVALSTSAMLWAWGSVAASVLAALVLVLDWARRRAAARAAEDAGARALDTSTISPVASATGESSASGAPDVLAADGHDDSHDDNHEYDDDRDEYDEVDSEDEPAEEDTDAADLLVVTDLDIPVVVVDERPRYHLANCRWLGLRPTLALPVREARQLGFTPCSVCGPDGSLAAAQRRVGRATTT